MRAASLLSQVGVVVGLIGSLALVAFGPAAPAVIRMYVITPGDFDSAKALFYSLGPVAIACAAVGIGLGLAYVGTVRAVHKPNLRPVGVTLLGISSAVMILASAGVAWYANRMHTSLRLNPHEISREIIEGVLAEITIPMRWCFVGLAIADLLLAVACCVGLQVRVTGDTEERPLKIPLVLAAVFAAIGPITAAVLLYYSRGLALDALGGLQFTRRQVMLWLTSVSYALGTLSLGLLAAGAMAGLAVVLRRRTSVRIEQ